MTVTNTYELEIELSRDDYQTACDEGRAEWPHGSDTVYVRIDCQDYFAPLDDVESLRRGQRESLVFTWHRTLPRALVPRPMTPERETWLQNTLARLQAERATRYRSGWPPGR